MKRLILLIGVLVLSFSTFNRKQPVEARAEPVPLIVAIGGNPGAYPDADFWAWYGPDQPLKQLTHYGHNGTPVYSPNGKYVAYQSVAKEILPFFANNNGVAGVLPSNIWLLDVATDTAMVLGSQPAGYTAKVTGGVLEQGIARSNPVWSSDSKFVAWTEDLPGGAEQLVIYDLAQKQSKIPITYSSFDVYPSQPVWGTLGLALFDTDDLNFADQVYDPQGKVLFSIPGAMTTDGETLNWVQDKDVTYLVIGGSATPEGDPNYIDLATGKQVHRLPLTEIYSITAPTGISLFRMGHCHDGVGCDWYVRAPGREPIPTFVQSDQRMAELSIPDEAISPDGQEAVYIGDDGQTYLYRGQVPELIESLQNKVVESFAWGTLGWRVRSPD